MLIKKQGLIAGAFKPYTSGHHFLISEASKQCDYVIVYVSTNDRVRKNEYPIMWNQMEKIWSKYICPSLPENIFPKFVQNPTVELYNHLQEINTKVSTKETQYYVYADKKDISYMESDRVKNKLNNLIELGILHTVSYDREKNVNVSGTLLRQTLQNNDYDKFEKLMPNSLKTNAKQIYGILRKNNGNQAY